MARLELLGWKKNVTKFRTTYLSPEGITLELPTNDKQGDFEYQYQKLIKKMSFYFGISQFAVENIFLNDNESITKDEIVHEIKENSLLFKGLRVYFGESDIYKTIVIINYYYDTDNLLVVETMNNIFAYSRSERYGLRIKYDTKGMYQGDKEYEMQTLLDALTQSTWHLNHIYFDKYDDKKKQFYDFDSFQKACLLSEINPISILHVLDNSRIDDISYVSKNKSFNEYIKFLREKAKYSIEIIE